MSSTHSFSANVVANTGTCSLRFLSMGAAGMPAYPNAAIDPSYRRSPGDYCERCADVGIGIDTGKGENGKGERRIMGGKQILVLCNSVPANTKSVETAGHQDHKDNPWLTSHQTNLITREGSEQCTQNGISENGASQ